MQRNLLEPCEKEREVLGNTVEGTLCVEALCPSTELGILDPHIVPPRRSPSRLWIVHGPIFLVSPSGPLLTTWTGDVPAPWNCTTPRSFRRRPLPCPGFHRRPSRLLHTSSTPFPLISFERDQGIDEGIEAPVVSPIPSPAPLSIPSPQHRPMTVQSRSRCGPPALVGGIGRV